MQLLTGILKDDHIISEAKIPKRLAAIWLPAASQVSTYIEGHLVAKLALNESADTVQRNIEKQGCIDIALLIVSGEF